MKYRLLVYLIWSSSLAYSQTHRIYSDDNRLCLKSTNTCISLFKTIYPINSDDFLDTLPPGKWILYSIPRKDSTKKNVEDFIIAEGEYGPDSTKNGLFRYNYTLIKNKTGKTATPLLTVSYHKGKLDGSCIARYADGTPHVIGQYSNNRINGQVLEFERSLKDFVTISEYENDTLKKWTTYYDGCLKQIGLLLPQFSETTIHLYKNCELFCTGNFNSSGLMRYVLYDSTRSKISESYGDFGSMPQIDKGQYLNKIAEKASRPIRGGVFYFDRNGNLVRKENIE